MTMMECMSPLKYAIVIWSPVAIWIFSIGSVYGQVNYYIVNDTNLERDLSAEKELVKTLLKRYETIGPDGRPVLNASRPVEVNYGLALIQMDLDEKEKILSVSMWTRYEWRDEYMTWDPTKYSNITSVNLQPKNIWIPDILLYNTAETDIESRDALAVVHADGRISWYPHCIFRSHCAIDVNNFPFDQQICHMWFGSWTYTSQAVDLQMSYPGGIDLSHFHRDHKESSIWDIWNVTANRVLMPASPTTSFAVLTFEMKMKRRLVFSSYMLTMPPVFLACITLVVFWLPPERPDRTALAMSSFASFMVLLLILVEAAMPTASSIPMLGVYYCFNMVLIMVAIILSSVVVNISRGSPKPAPNWMCWITIHVFARILCIKSLNSLRIKRVRNRNRSKTNGTLANEDICNILPSETTELVTLDNSDSDVRDNKSSTQTLFQNSPAHHTLFMGLEKQMRDVRKIMQRMESRFEDQKSQEKNSAAIMREYKAIALVLDRFFFVLYVITIICSLFFMFPRPMPVE